MSRILTQGFSTFLRRRRAEKHFKRLPLLDTLVALHAPVRRAGGPGVAVPGQEILAAAREEPAAALASLQSQPGGLDSLEAARRLVRDGPNEVQHEPPLPNWLRLWRCYLNPFNLLLTALALLSFLSADVKATVVIGVMVALSTGIRFVQEVRSHRAGESLQAMVRSTATVIRSAAGQASTAVGTPPARPQEIALRDLVAGDVVALSAGDMIPADCRLLHGAVGYGHAGQHAVHHRRAQRRGPARGCGSRQDAAA